MLITEQGFGDTLQFVRFAPLLKRQGAGDVILECPEKLIKLLSRSPGIDHLVPQGKPLPDYDVYCALMNVPGLTATSVEAIPAEVPYIIPDPDLVAHWKRELAGIPGFKVGHQLARQSEVRRRPSPLGPAGILRAAIAGAGSAALQPSKERTGSSSSMRSGASFRSPTWA